MSWALLERGQAEEASELAASASLIIPKPGAPETEGVETLALYSRFRRRLSQRMDCESDELRSQVDPPVKEDR